MKKIVYIAIIFLLAFLIVNNSLTDQYVAILKGESELVSRKTDSLYEEIKLRAKEFEVPPVNAKVDPVWKAVPGYNGLKVDVEASYKRMKETGGFNAERLIFEQIKPAVHLEDLPPSPVYKGNPDKPMVSFLINVAWGNEYLSPILATLKEYHVHASFFLEGRWVKNNPELAQMIAAAGHEIGNHSYSHPDMKLISAGKIREEIKKANTVIEATTGKTPVWFAPPSGSYRDEVVKIAFQEGMGTVLWSVDTIDWKKPKPVDLISRVSKNIHNGAILLMHPTQSTEQALGELIMNIKEKGYEIDTISELFKEERILKKSVTK